MTVYLVKEMQGVTNELGPLQKRITVIEEKPTDNIGAKTDKLNMDNEYVKSKLEHLANENDIIKQTYSKKYDDLEGLMRS